MSSLGFREGNGSTEKVSTKPQVFFFSLQNINRRLYLTHLCRGSQDHPYPGEMNCWENSA